MKTQPAEGDLVQFSDLSTELGKVTFLTPPSLEADSEVIGIPVFFSAAVPPDSILAMWGLKEGPKITGRLYVLLKNEG